MQRALGDLQTGVVDTNNLRNSLTDPTTVAILDEMEVEIAKHEQHVADLLHKHLKENKRTRSQPHPPPAQPSAHKNNKRSNHTSNKHKGVRQLNVTGRFRLDGMICIEPQRSLPYN
jgi:hypothetical protein